LLGRPKEYTSLPHEQIDWMPQITASTWWPGKTGHVNRVIAKRPSNAKVDDDAAYHPVWGAGGLPGGTLLPSSKMTITLSMRNSTSECSLPVCKVCAISPFLALRLGDLARAAGLRAGDLALAAGFRAGDWARPRGAGEAARLARRVATMGVAA
jgi:hypothetical protein